MNVELIKKEVVPVFQPMTVQVTIGTQEEYDAIQRAGTSLVTGEIIAFKGASPYTYFQRTVWVELLELIAKETERKHT